jgi:hypothetical protein
MEGKMTRPVISDKHIWWLIAWGWLAFVFGPPVYNRLDYMFNTTPWFEAEIEVLDGGTIGYTQTISRDLTGDWQGWIEVGGNQVCGGYGVGTYPKTPRITKYYSLAYFLGAQCAVPAVPYRVCAAWTHTDKAGYRRSVGPVCSADANLDP